MKGAGPVAEGRGEKAGGGRGHGRRKRRVRRGCREGFSGAVLTLDASCLSLENARRNGAAWSLVVRARCRY